MGLSSHRILICGLAAVAAVLLAGWGGWVLNDLDRPSHAVRVSDTFRGRVTTVNGPGNAGCVRPDTGGRPVCSQFAVLGNVRVRPGDTVRVAHEWVDADNGDAYDLVLLYPVQPPI